MRIWTLLEEQQIIFNSMWSSKSKNYFCMKILFLNTKEFESQYCCFNESSKSTEFKWFWSQFCMRLVLHFLCIHWLAYFRFLHDMFSWFPLLFCGWLVYFALAYICFSFHFFCFVLFCFFFFICVVVCSADVVLCSLFIENMHEPQF